MTERGRLRQRASERLRGALEEPVDIAFLAAFRGLFGGVMAVSMLRFIGYGWIDGLFVTPSLHFRYWPFHSLPVLAGTGLHVLFWGLLGCSVCVALGLFFRLASVLFVLGFLYLQLVDVTTYLNHYYLAVLLACLLALSPAGQAYSLDAWRGGGAAIRAVPGAWLWLLRFQVAVVYTFAALAKAHADWLLHGQPLGIWLAARTDTPLLGPLFMLPHAAVVMSWCGFLFDLTAPWLLSFRRTRPYAYALVLVFHALTRLLFPIGMFPVIMVLSALVFFPSDWPRALLAKLGAKGVSASGAPRVAGHGITAKPALVALGLFGLLQVLWPMRCLAYGGNVRWHEQGMRFSWRVMVREKNGSVTFYVRDTRTGRELTVSPHRYLTGLQEREMSGQPDLILQFAHFLHDEFAGRGMHDPEVRAEAWVSLNGRRAALLVDPTRDLAKVRDGLMPADWILDAPSGPPVVTALVR